MAKKAVMNGHEFREFPAVPGTGSPYIWEPVRGTGSDGNRSGTAFEVIWHGALQRPGTSTKGELLERRLSHHGKPSLSWQTWRGERDDLPASGGTT